jgi:hypothetical protein
MELILKYNDKEYKVKTIPYRVGKGCKDCFMVKDCNSNPDLNIKCGYLIGYERVFERV